MKPDACILFMGIYPVLLGVGCATTGSSTCSATTTGPGTCSDDGYLHIECDYEVPPVSEDSSALLPQAWIIHKHCGEYDDPETGVVECNENPCVYRSFGRRSDSFGEFLRYDVLFENRGGIIWIGTEPLPSKMKEKDLAVLLDREVKAYAGILYSGSWMGVMRFRASKERVFATKTLDVTRGTVAGMKAVAATVDIVDVNALRLDRSTPHDRMRLVLISTRFRVETDSQNKDLLPVLLIAGYANSDSDFDKGIADFNNFISRISVSGKTGAAFQPVKPDSPVQ